MSATYFTSILIWLPIAGAIVDLAAAALALRHGKPRAAHLVRRGRVLDRAGGALRLLATRPADVASSANWFGDLGVSYHVGVYGFSVWLVGLTVVVMAACIGYGFWVGRDRPRAYFGLMLLLTGATVGVFESQDLLLFYAFFEAMLIPLYILIGVWGGARRMEATVKFVIYTMAGSLLMLAAIVVYGLKAGTFDLVDGPTSTSRWLFLGFMVAFAIKSPLFPFHGWLPDAYREAPPEVTAVLSGVIAKAGLYGMLRIAIPNFPEPDVVLPDGGSRARRRSARLRLAARLPRAGLPRRRRVLVARAVGADRARPLRRHRPRLRRRGAADGRARARLGLALPPRRRGRTADDDRRVPAARRDGARPARARDAAHDARRDLARRARLRDRSPASSSSSRASSSARGGGR